jgi:nitrogenase molybdenum-iron protein NifN
MKGNPMSGCNCHQSDDMVHTAVLGSAPDRCTAPSGCSGDCGCDSRGGNPDSITAAGLPADPAAVPASATRNACKLCAPLGAALVFKGIEGCLPFLHGSQGCATYIRRYLISHFREPVDIASSSFSEDDAIFGGARNFADGLDNVIRQYHPTVIGVATTCLSETIGDHMTGMIKSYREERATVGPPLIHVSTPAYSGTHSDGYHAAIREVLTAFASSSDSPEQDRINIIPAMMSCADLRHLSAIARAFGLTPTLLPDYSETLEGGSWADYHRIPTGGTSVSQIAAMGTARATISFGHLDYTNSGGNYLASAFKIPHTVIPWPLGLQLNDRFIATLSEISGQAIPTQLATLRARLIDAYVDAHKYLMGKTAAVFGEPDLVLGVATFLAEIGIRPIICASGAKIKNWKGHLEAFLEGGAADIEALSGADHATLSNRARELKPDLLIGSSKGYPLARELGIPLVRIGFPIHDRFGSQRLLRVGYEGSLAFFDELVNTILEGRQSDSTTGYSYQ